MTAVFSLQIASAHDGVVAFTVDGFDYRVADIAHLRDALAELAREDNPRDTVVVDFVRLDESQVQWLLDAAARAWHTRTQHGRMDAGRFKDDGTQIGWDDLQPIDQHAYREVVLPIVAAALRAVDEAGS